MATDTSCEFPDLRGRTALVTGGARGLGRSVAEALMRSGAEVCVFDAAKSAPDFGGIDFHNVDIRDADAIADAIAQLQEPPLLLVNNAGITRDRTIVKMSDDEWRDVIDVNLTGAFNMIRACAPAMVAAGHGRIVNITSINGLRGKFGQTNYSASKAGLIGLTKATARELGRKGVTVNAIAPGMVLTDMARALPEALLDDARSESALGVLAEPVDIANAVLFLLSDAARMITGQVLQVDAGQYL
jgi:acetoacetyl-CoA reductase/3-oxoacyl-[acyl-carrier protein] reductase